MTLWSILAVVLAFIIGAAAAYAYVIIVLGVRMKPQIVDVVPRMMEMFRNDEHGWLLMGRRQMIEEIKHQIEAHGLLHHADIITWLDKMDAEFAAEGTRRGENMGLEARRQFDAEEASKKDHA